MQNKITKANKNKITVSFLLSLIFHVIIFFSASYYFWYQDEKSVVNSVYLTVLKSEIQSGTDIENEPDLYEKKEEKTKTVSGAYFRFDRTDFDSTNIKQVYREYTLNVSVRYPNGWTYIDQNVKDKLDGVTFWTHQGNYEVPPYIHLEVQDKNFFNPERYNNVMEYNGSLYYYNDPEELEGYFTQIIYIRTNTDEDFSIKLIIKGREAFISFQPVFFNMVKSFRFGNSFF